MADDQRAQSPSPAIPSRPVAQLFLRARDLPVVVALVAVAWIYAEARVRRAPGFFAGDLLTQFVPYYTELGSRLRGGDIPGWNASLFSGVPFAGDPISGWGYLPVMASFAALPPISAYTLFVGIHLALAGVATYLLGRALGLAPFAAAVAGLIMMIGPHLHHAQCCTARFQLAPWIPLGLLAVEGALRGGSRMARWRWLALGGFVITQMIAGYFGKGMMYGGLVIAAWLVYRTLLEAPQWLAGRPFVRRLGACVAILGPMLTIAGGLGAAVILPRLAYLGASNLAGGSYEGIAGPGGVGGGWSIDRLLWAITNPKTPAYSAGIFVVAVAVMSMLLVGRRFGAPFFAATTAIILGLALRDSLLVEVFGLLPKFRAIHEHEPHRVLMLLSFPLAMLAGFVVEMLPAQRWTPIRLLRTAVVATALWVVAIGVTGAADRAIAGDLQGALLAAPALVAALALVPRAWPRPVTRQRVGTVASVLLAVLLIASADRDRLWPAVAARWQVAAPTSPSAQFLDADDATGAGGFLAGRLAATGPFRYFGFDERMLSGEESYLDDNYRRFWRDPAAAYVLVDNRALTLGLQDIQGYNPVQYSTYISFVNAINGQPQEYHETNILPAGLDSPLWRLLNVAYIVVPADGAPGSHVAALVRAYPTVFATDRVLVLEVPDALPRFWTVHETQTAPPGSELAALAAPAFDPRVTAIVADLASIALEPAGATGDRITSVSSTDDRIVLDVAMASTGLLVASEIDADGWVATIDGERVDIVTTDGILRGIIVPAGTHRVEMTYRPASLRAGIAITSGTTIVIMLLLGPWSWRRRRRRDRADDASVIVASRPITSG